MPDVEIDGPGVGSPRLGGYVAVPAGDGPWPGVRPEPTAAVDAWQRIEAYLGEHLDSVP